MVLPGKFRVLRPFWLCGAVVPAGAVIELDDRHMVTELLSLGKVEPADDATRARLRAKALVEWGAVADVQTSAGGWSVRQW